MNEELLSKITKRSQLEFDSASDEDQTLDFKGGMVTILHLGGFRKRSLIPGTVKLHSPYEGKRDGVITQFVAVSSALKAALKNCESADGYNSVVLEIPIKDFDRFFDPLQVEELLRKIVPEFKQLGKSETNLYSEEFISELFDFGVF